MMKTKLILFVLLFVLALTTGHKMPNRNQLF